MATAWWRSIVGRQPRAPRRRRTARHARSFRPLLEALEDRSLPSVTLTPDTFADNNSGSPGSGQFSLRDAILLANADTQNDIIQLSSGTFTLSVAGANEDAAATGDLDITKTTGTLTIQGAGSGQTIIDGTNLGDRIFQMFAGTQVILSGVTISGGQVEGQGGGIDNAGTLTIENSTITNNAVPAYTTSGHGGGINNTGTLTVIDSTVSNNSAGQTSAPYGAQGGGIASTGTLTLTNTTLSGNSANDNGGGLEIFSGAANLTNVTLTGNIANSDGIGGGGGGGLHVAAGTVTLTNTLSAGNLDNLYTGSTSDDAYGTVSSSSSYNLIAAGDGVTGISNGKNGNQIGSASAPLNAQLGTLADNGGNGPYTCALLTGSPALDAGTSADAPTADERGVLRYGAVDIGAYEYNPFAITNTNTSGTGSLLQAILNSNASTGGNTITFAIGLTGTAQTIPILSASEGQQGLPVITQPVTLDGWSQGGAGYTGPPLIELDGSNAAAGVQGTFGFNIQANNVTVRGFAINRFAQVNGNGFAIGVFAGTGTWIYGNYLGTDTTGLSAEGNGQGGIWVGVNGSQVLIGTNADGTNDAAEANVIAANGPGEGILIQSADNVVAGNFIGVGIDGTTSLANSGPGIRIDGANNTVGGILAGTVNVIAGNTGDGILLNGDAAAGNVIEGNSIGIASCGCALGNGGAGVHITGGAFNNTIGSTASEAGNVIANNGTRTSDSGVHIDSGTGNAIQRNDIYGNVGLGIDLASASANNQQSAPVLSQATYAGNTLSVSFAVLSDTSSSTYPLTVEFFRADASGQGELYLGSATYSAAAAQTVQTVNFTPTVALTASDSLVSTATDSAGNTSEFSAAFGVNVPPVITLSSGAASYTEDSSPTLIDPAATASDANNTAFTGGTLTVDFPAGALAEDQLSLANQGSGTGQVSVSGNTVSYGGAVIGSVSGADTSTLVVSFNSSAYVAAVQAVMQAISFADVSYNPASPQTVRFVLTDGAGGTSNAATRVIDITRVNHAPALSNNASLTAPAVAEDTPDNGTLVSGLISAGLITDPDPGAVQGLAITGADSSRGRWQFSTNDGGAWSDIGTVSDTSARLLAADTQTRLRFVPALDFNGTIANALTFRAWDQTTGTNGGSADASVNGGHTAFSSTTGTASLTVTPQAATHFLVSITGTASAGQPLSVTVTAQDRYNTLASAYRGTIHFTSSDAVAVLPADYTFTAADAGTHTFTGLLTLWTAGSQTVTAQDTGSAGVQGTATAPVRAVNLAPTVTAGPETFLGVGSLFVGSGSFQGASAVRWTATVDYGDGTGRQLLTLNADHTFALAHVYEAEGSFLVTVTVADEDAASGSARFFVHAFVAGPVMASAAVAPPGQTVTAAAGGVTMTIERAPFDLGDAIIVVAQLPNPPLAVVLSRVNSLGLLQVNAALVTVRLVVFDIRAINVSGFDRAVVTFTVESPDGFAPQLSVLDPVTRLPEPVQGSQLVPGSLTVTPVPGTKLFQIRVVFDATSSPKLTELGGTIFPVSVQVDPPPAPLSAVPTTVASAAGGPSDGLSVSFARTGYVSGSERTLAVAPSQSGLTGSFGYGGPPSPRDNDTALAQEVLTAAHSAYWAQPDDATQPAAAVPEPPAVAPGAGEPESEDEVSSAAAISWLFARQDDTTPAPAGARLDAGLVFPEWGEPSQGPAASRAGAGDSGALALALVLVGSGALRPERRSAGGREARTWV